MKRNMIFLGVSLCLVGCGYFSNSVNFNIPVVESPSVLEDLSRIDKIDKVDISPVFDENIPLFVVNENPEDPIKESPNISQNKDWQIFVRHMGSNATSKRYVEPSDILRKTGNSMPNNLVIGSGKGSFIRQSKEGFESYIDTSTFPTYDIRGAGPHTVISTNLDVAAIGAGIYGTFNLPTVKSIGGGVSQLSLFTYLHTRSNLNQGAIALVNLISDSRTNQVNFSPYVGSDTYTFFVSQPIDKNVFATSLTKNPATAYPFSESRVYGFIFTRENITNILKSVSDVIQENKNKGVISPEIDMNPDNYFLSATGVIQETFVFNNKNIVSNSGYNVKNLRIFSEKK